MFPAAEWNSLELAKLVVGAATPILLAFIGIFVARAARRVEERQWLNQKLIERRLALYEEMAPKLNDIYASLTLRGHFKEVTPPEVIKRKRDVDRTFYAHAPLFSNDFRAAYHAFADTCFSHYSGVGEDAKLRADRRTQQVERRKAEWQRDWDAMFDDQAVSSPKEFDEAYNRLMDAFSGDVGVPTEEQSS